MRRRPASHRRSGTVLVLFALLLVALLALAALTVDLGLVRVTQRQMQSLSDAAAVEALRNLGGSAEDRQAAAQAVISPTTGSLDDTQTGDSQRFGAGPLLNFTGGTALGDGFSGIQKVSIANPRVYQPTLAVNDSNAVDGDIVQGTYTAMQTTADPEADGYTRADFTASTTGNAILVRLRRSNENFLSNDPSRSNGPPLPYLFGRGTMLAPQAKGQGVTVRATSIAAASPVLSAGPTLSAQNLPGVAPFMLQFQSWQTWVQANPSATSVSATVDAAGNISGNVTGAFTIRPTTATVIGQPFTPLGSTTQLFSQGPGQDSYVPLYDTIGGQNLVVGFLNMSGPPGPTLSGGTLTMQLSSAVAAGNVTAALTAPLSSNLTTAQVSGLFSDNRAITNPLQAPALVR